VDRGRGEVKTKPTQHSVRELMEIGIQPDFLICRAERPLAEDVKRKISLFCNVDFGSVVESVDVPTIYQIPLAFHDQGFDARVCQRLACRRASPTSPSGASWCAASSSRARRCASRWSGSTPTTSTATRACRRR
jgi:CTP synthase